MSTAQGRLTPPVRASLDAVLSFAWDTGVFVSADAMGATGLTRSTTIESLDELIDLGLLRELPNSRDGGEYSKGRPARRFELRADAAVVVGIDAGRSHLTTTVADLRGRVLVSERRERDLRHETADGRRAAVHDAIDGALETLGRSRCSVLAVCVGVPAPVDSRGVSPQHRDGFWRLMNPDLAAALAEWAPIVRIENDASLAAVAEGAIGGAVGSRDYVVLLAGDRLGAGVVVDGHLLRGAHGGAGEMLAFDRVEGVGTAEGLGLRLTEWVREAAAAGEVPPRHPLAGVAVDELTGRAVLGLARSGDEWSRAFVRRAGAVLARVAGIFGSLYDPERVIISGAVAEGLGEAIEEARRLLPEELDLPAPELLLSTLGADSVVTGAVAAAVKAAREGALTIGGSSSRTVDEILEPAS
ncbi:ROK family protein [Marisediminicola senii]|uniref:ROK family protein n=1 Tax=Marisediminicola senii TaxID=2711233 RepID=UPI001F31D539|nr:ROK family protein [Marisediminicola senii]